jgi:hypothetical protein
VRAGRLRYVGRFGAQDPDVAVEGHEDGGEEEDRVLGNGGRLGHEGEDVDVEGGGHGRELPPLRRLPEVAHTQVHMPQRHLVHAPAAGARRRGSGDAWRRGGGGGPGEGGAALVDSGGVGGEVGLGKGDNGVLLRVAMGVRRCAGRSERESVSERTDRTSSLKTEAMKLPTQPPFHLSHSKLTRSWGY